MNECPRHKLPRNFLKQKCAYCARLYATCKACTDEAELLEIDDTCPRCYATKGLQEARDKKMLRDNEANTTRENLEDLKKKYDRIKSQLQSLVKQYKDLKSRPNERLETPAQQIDSLTRQLETTKLSYSEMEKLYFHLDELSSNFDYLVDAKDSGFDITIECGGKRFRVHSLVLSARSNVLKPLCKQAAMDKTYRFRIDDLRSDILKEVVHYVYSGRCNVNDNNALEIYLAAERFAIRALKVSVENYLMDIFNKRNALDILIAFDAYHNLKMKSKCIQKINASFQELFETAEWNRLKAENPDLVYQVYESKIHKK